MANVFDYIFNIGGNFSAEISGMSAATGNFTASVEGADSGVRKFTGSLATFSYLKDVFQNVADGFSQLSGAGIKLDSQMHDLSAVAGVTGDGLKQIEKFARDLYTTLDMPGELERFEQLAENVREIQRQQEQQEQLERQRLEYLRQQRAQAWADAAQALGQMAQGINNAVSQYNATKQANKAKRSSATSKRTSSGTSSSARKTSAATSSSSTSLTKAKTPNFGNRKALETAYETAKQTVMNYYYGKYTWNLSEVRARQQSMRDTRAKAQKQGFTIYKSEFEDVSEPYRK